MEKDFDAWNERKKNIDGKNTPEFRWKEKEVRWCELGLNIGDEENGKDSHYVRPVVILKKFSNRSCLVVALTTKRKSGKYYLYLGEINNEHSTAIISQIRFVDARRLLEYVATLSDEKFLTLSNEIVRVCFI
jgi:mRNA-degrading endonuclease toxin of MazEF toxin-antitoxin module